MRRFDYCYAVKQTVGARTAKHFGELHRRFSGVHFWEAALHYYMMIPRFYSWRVGDLIPSYM
jgi:hypothetical protein